MQDEQTRTHNTLGRRALPILALLLVVALALDYAALRDQVRRIVSHVGHAPQGDIRSLSSPDETAKVLAKLGLQWRDPGPPVVLFTKRG